MSANPFFDAITPVMDNLVREIITPEELAERESVVALARPLVNTARWVHMGREAGGLDCAGVIEYVFKKSGFVPADAGAGYYPEDFMMHVFDQRFLRTIEQFARKVPRTIPLPGDIALYYYGMTRVGPDGKLERLISHCALVEEWPIVIHALKRERRVVRQEGNLGELEARFAGIWSLNKWS